MENINYEQINIDEARKENCKLHCVGYNFLVSSISSSTKGRMTTDSFMHTETGLILNNVTNPLEVPNLWETSIHSRFYKHFAMFDIKEISKSVRIYIWELYAFLYLPPKYTCHQTTLDFLQRQNKVKVLRTTAPGQILSTTSGTNLQINMRTIFRFLILPFEVSILKFKWKRNRWLILNSLVR